MDESYEGREQSAAKHLILENYLEKLAYKVGFYRARLTLNYIDGFAGPWESKTADLSDTSPSLALSKLDEVRAELGKRGKAINVRAFFVSPTERGADQLRALQMRFPAAEIVVVKSTFEGALDDARRFAAIGHDPFTFIFIDHTGWSGFGLQEITPLLRGPSNEVLINFMTGHITRFIDSDDSRYEPTFRALFGDDSASYRADWRGLSGLDREERIIATYCRRIADAGGYTHCASSVILNPLVNRTHFHLVYGTRSDEGLATFREVERAGLKFQRVERAGAQQRDRVSRSGQGELFNGSALVARTYEDELRDRYLSRAVDLLDAMTRTSGDASWDELVLAVLQIPMISEADVKDWLKEQRRSGTIEVHGLEQHERVPKRNHGHCVRRLK